ncbi:MAG: NAD(P)-dependent glycerol-3-phosphate dehydrogenase [Dehalococcoidia bacterium]|nr:NAD(P)-dependent glycerol-3-phosphate dehydrogenase [Dehalococcoidia bacterium]
MATPSPTPAAVVGATTWGATLAIILARRGVPVRLLARTDEEARGLDARREHARLPGHRFPPTLALTADPREALAGASVMVVAVPSSHVRAAARGVAGCLGDDAVVISAAKGIELGTLKRMSEVIAEELPSARVCALSGPNLAKEVADGLPSTTVIASADSGAAQAAQALLNSGAFRVYTNADLVGTELGGVLKNIVAIGSGVVHGLGMGDNARAALVNRGLAEMTRLGVAAGASPLTFAGLAGMGDLIATCYSPLSRNHRLGIELGRGKPLDEALAALGGQVAEGVNATRAALDMAARLGVEMPIAQVTGRVLFEGMSPREAAAALMSRAPRAEAP